MSTRIVIKNLPGWINEEKLKELFEQKGCITDCSIKYNSSGKSRRFAFIGYSTPEAAESAIKYFDNSCIGTSRVKVEVCRDLSDALPKKPALPIKTYDPNKPRFSKSMVPEEIAADPKFAEFLNLHERNDKAWANDLVQDKAASTTAAVQQILVANAEPIKAGDVVVENGDNTEVAEAYASMVKLKNLPFNVSKEQIKQFFCGLDVARIVMSGQKRKPGEASACHVEFADSKAVDQALRRNKSFLGGKKVLVVRVVRTTANKKDQTDRQSKKHGFTARSSAEITADVSDSGRLYVRNLSYLCTEDDIQELFSKYGELSEVYLPLEKLTKQNKGFAFVSYLMPEHAVKALNELDGTSFQGRMLHIIPAETKPEPEKANETSGPKAGSSFKSEKEAALRQTANSSHNWNALFVGTNAVVDNVAADYGADKKHLFDQSGAAVRMALGETEIVLKTKSFLEEHGVHLEAFGKPVVKRSKTIILVKNLPAKTRMEEVKAMFAKYGTIARLVVPPSGVTGLVEFSDSNEAKNAFRSLAYRRFKDLPLYLEWAPADVFATDAPLLKDIKPSKQEAAPSDNSKSAPQEESKPQRSQSEPGVQSPAVPFDDSHTTVFVKNLNFKTTEERLVEFFNAKFPGKVVKATIAKNKDSRQHILSLGYGFIEFTDAITAQDALKQMQHAELDEHKLDLKISINHVKASNNKGSSKSSAASEAKPSTRVLVRNIPFEANGKDIQELFAVFGNLRSVRLPKKAVTQAVGSVSGRSGGGRAANLHRGFGFVDFHSVEEAKRAFDALRHSTHLYGRRLVLEWAKTDEAELVEELRAKAAERAVASAAAASGAVHAGGAKRLKKTDLVASVERITKNAKENDEAME